MATPYPPNPEIQIEDGVHLGYTCGPEFFHEIYVEDTGVIRVQLYHYPSDFIFEI